MNLERVRLPAVTAVTLLILRQSKRNYLELTMDIIRLIFAIILPPVGVFLQVGLSGAFWLNILLTLLGYIPGIIHAVYIILKR